MNVPGTLTRSVLAGLLLATAGCRQSPPGWMPVLEMTSTSHLERRVARTLDQVARARERLQSEPAQAAELLQSAEDELRSLDQTYLPLFGARARAFNAYRHHLLGRNGEAARDLETIEETLVEVGDGARGALLTEVEGIQDLVSEARLELEGNPSRATTTLRRLARALEHLVAKEELFL